MNFREYSVYILTNAWRTVLYTGMTNSLHRRIWQHKQKEVAGFTKHYNCDRLVYFDSFTQVTDAVAAEKRIKGWVRWKKIALIEQQNPEWKDLAAEWYGANAPGILRSAQDDRENDPGAPGILRSAQDDRGNDPGTAG